MAENLNLQSLFYLGSLGGKTLARHLPLSSLSQLLMAPNCFLRKILEKILQKISQNQIDAISFQAKIPRRSETSLNKLSSYEIILTPI